jgi:hypothetical protein
MKKHQQAVRFATAIALCVARLLLAQSAAASEGESLEFHRHHVGVFLGGGSRPQPTGDTLNGFAGGVDYEYRFSRWVGVGGLVEAASGDLRDAVVAGVVFAHPWKGLLFGVGLGAEISSHSTEFVARLGAAYQFPIGERFTIAPTFDVDLVHGKPTYIYGITFGVGF